MPIIKQVIKEQHRGKVLWVIQKQYVTIPLSGIYNLDSRIQTTHKTTTTTTKQIAQVKGLMNLPSSLCLQGTESISNFWIYGIDNILC